ncbi:MAG: NADH-quinone oxidoreductase subunit J, partial [Candidatus Wenzhouxiangella sp. M2_3B_020]
IVVAFWVDWGPVTVEAPDAAMQTRALGMELLGRSMLIFETAGVTILTAMIAATAVAIPVQARANKGEMESPE